MTKKEKQLIECIRKYNKVTTGLTLIIETFVETLENDNISSIVDKMFGEYKKDMIYIRDTLKEIL